MKYIADRLKTSTFLVLCLTIVMVTLASCSDNNAEDPDLKRFKNRFSGDYQYSSAIWTGGNIDLDGDGTGHKNLDEEFRGTANDDDGKIDPVGITFQHIIINARWMDIGDDGQIVVSEYFIENPVYSIPDIIYVDVTSVTDDSFEVTVECSLYDQNEDKLAEGTVIFTFTRK